MWTSYYVVVDGNVEPLRGPLRRLLAAPENHQIEKVAVVLDLVDACCGISLTALVYAEEMRAG